MTRTSVALAAGASRSRAARAANDVRNLTVGRFMFVVPPEGPSLSWTVVQGKWLSGQIERTKTGPSVLRLVVGFRRQEVDLVLRRDAHDLGRIGEIVQLVEQRFELLHR